MAKTDPLFQPDENYLIFAPNVEDDIKVWISPLLEEISKERNGAEQKTIVLTHCKKATKKIGEILQKLTDRMDSKSHLNIFCDFGETENNILRTHGIMVTTPKRAVDCIRKSQSKISNLVYLDIDSLKHFGYKIDLKTLNELTEKSQKFAISRSFDKSSRKLGKNLIKSERNPTKIIKNSEKIAENSENDHKAPKKIAKKVLFQSVNRNEKYLLVYSLFKLGIVSGKTIILTKDTKESYEMKIFLKRFSISSLVLNLELPAAMAKSVKTKFNKGISNILILSYMNIDKANEEIKITKMVVDFSFHLNTISKAKEKLKSNKGTVLLSFVDSDDKKQIKKFSKLKSKIKIDPLGLQIEDMKPFVYRVSNTLSSIKKTMIKLEPFREMKKETAMIKDEKDEETQSFLKRNQRKFVKIGDENDRSVFIDEVPFYLLPKSNTVSVGPTKNYQEDDFLDKGMLKRKRKLQGNKNKRRRFKRHFIKRKK